MQFFFLWCTFHSLQPQAHDVWDGKVKQIRQKTETAIPADAAQGWPWESRTVCALTCSCRCFYTAQPEASAAGWYANVITHMLTLATFQHKTWQHSPSFSRSYQQAASELLENKCKLIQIHLLMPPVWPCSSEQVWWTFYPNNSVTSSLWTDSCSSFSF